jgi:hypothetical protein
MMLLYSTTKNKSKDLFCKRITTKTNISKRNKHFKVYFYVVYTSLPTSLLGNLCVVKCKMRWFRNKNELDVTNKPIKSKIIPKKVYSVISTIELNLINSHLLKKKDHLRESH